MARFIEWRQRKSAAGTNPPEVRQLVWDWLRRKVGLRGATVIFVAAAVLLLFGSHIPALYQRVVTYFGRATETPGPAVFADGELHIGIAILTDDGPSPQLFDEIARQFTGSKVVFVHPIQLSASGSVADIAQTDAAVRSWLIESNADASLWAYSQQRADGQLATRLWWTGRAQTQSAFSDSFGGLATFLVNDWLGPSSIEFPTLDGLTELQAAALLVKDFAWRALLRDTGQSEFELEIRSEEREQFEKIEARVCNERSSAQCKIFRSARVRWELLLPQASELSRGEFDFAAALQLPSQWPNAPRNKAEFLSYIQFVAGMTREAASADDTISRLDQLVILLSPQPWQLGKTLEEELPEAGLVLDALKMDARLARLITLANFEWEGLDQAQRETAKAELVSVLNESVQLSSRMDRARSLPRFVQGAVEMTVGLGFAVLDTMQRQYGVIQGLRTQAIRATQRGYELLSEDSPNYRALRVSAMEMFLLVYASGVSTLTAEDAQRFLSMAETTLGQLPADISQAVRSDLIALSLALQVRLHQTSGQAMPCEWIERWSDAQRRLADAGEWVWDGRFPRTAEFFFQAYAKATPEADARQCLRAQGYDYDRLLAEMKTAMPR